jgi:hypothetical protein
MRPYLKNKPKAKGVGVWLKRYSGRVLAASLRL